VYFFGIRLLIAKKKNVRSVHNLILICFLAFLRESIEHWAYLKIIDRINFFICLIDFSLDFEVFSYGLDLIKSQLLSKMKGFELVGIEYGGDGTFKKQQPLKKIRDIELFLNLLFAFVVLNS
jgi:hypothetical protein